MIFRGLPGKVAAIVAVVMLAAAFSTTPALAASNRTYGYVLPGGDQIRTDIWLGNMYWNSFSAQSSTLVLGYHPYYPYITDDTLQVSVNGWDITVGWPPSGHVISYSSATFSCEEIYTGYCGNQVSNINVQGGVWWNNTGNDQSRTILYQNTQPYYNNAGVTNWCC